MPAFAIILMSTLLGLFGAPLSAALVCGLLLAAYATLERAATPLRSNSARTVSAFVLAASGSLAIGQIASIGTFATGRLIFGLLIG